MAVCLTIVIIEAQVDEPCIFPSTSTITIELESVFRVRKTIFAQKLSLEITPSSMAFKSQSIKYQLYL